MKQLFADHGTDLLKGAVGIMASVLSVLTSFQENVEYYMRVGALAAGMLVSALTAVSIIRGWNKKQK
jgi:hypothetical protein